MQGLKINQSTADLHMIPAKALFPAAPFGAAQNANLMLPFLAAYASRTPEWISRLTADDIAGGPKPWMAPFLADAMVYPGAGNDASPVRQFQGVVRAFLFIDLDKPIPEVRAELERKLDEPRLTGIGFRNHRPLGIAEFDASPLLGPVDRDHWAQQQAKSDPRRGIWAVYQNIEDPADRFVFMAIQAEAISTLACLYPSRPPGGIVIQEHGVTGQGNWHFLPKLLRLSEQWRSKPMWCVVGDTRSDFIDDWKKDWMSDYRQLGQDVAQESQNKNTRTVLRKRLRERMGVRYCYDKYKNRLKISKDKESKVGQENLRRELQADLDGDQT
jgi:hypothetical protein